MTALPTAQACERNREPILDVLRRELADRGHVLEIGSGTGQHAVHFAAAMPHLVWQTSDLPENHPAIAAWLNHAQVAGVRVPLSLDVRSADVDALAAYDFDAVFSANTAHIMSEEAVEQMFTLVGAILRADGVFCLYGPFRFAGQFTSDSNAAFDASLRHRDRSMGVRDLDDLDEVARTAGLERARLYAMPANNHLAVWVKRAIQGQRM